eukprot:scaffold86_cov98-Skeletonema_dohrnii-CCMP3373.AAC.1
MVTLIRTLKRITPAPPPNNKSLETKTATLTAQTAHNTSASHVHHGQIKETETTSDAIEMNKKESDSSAVTLRLSSTSSQKPFATADTSDVKSAAADPDERNTQTKFDRKRKASTDEDEELPTKKADVNKYKNICSANGCTNVVVQGGVCVRHGARVKRQLCSREECTNQAVQGGVCVRHGAKGKRKRCSSEGCTNQAIKGGVCMRHGAKVKLCSSEGCTTYARKGGVCMRHGANPWDAA